MARRVRRAHLEAPELNITAFLNLMVILVPFLLITAVFSHMTVLELNLPPQKKQNPQQLQQKKEMNFELILRKDQIVVSETINGPIKTFEKTANGFNMKEVSDLLLKIKSRFPDKKNITILLEPKVPYETLVQAMDASRAVRVVEVGTVVQKELFPVISIGDAPG
ncbi:MAG: biopolymer transporter ExbD [Gammaproteobacteria bacterium]|nr:biopolymer transporter ExbD [Gammaproteobacteria bacterium]MDH5800778.1 biopolymer transporter ExbD [Gammaproteobacteria bacterium]